MFMAFPLNGKPDWRNPPWVTILLVVINCIIYFGPQMREENAWGQAQTYYAKSSLPPLELPRYAAYLQQHGSRQQRDLATKIEAARTPAQALQALHLMEWDQRFQTELHAGRIIRPDESSYAEWRRQRLEFDRLKGPRFTSRWASNPADWNLVSMITATFLHGSIAHLIGNMVFLFAFGYTVERTLGARRYLLFYLLAGIAGEAGDLLARWGSPVIGLGASGAISGLMAMYAVLYGTRRIRFFYQFLFYFDYVTAPAIILLPIWIGHELLQQAFNSEGGVAYMAHAGGLISGALLIWWHKRRHPETTVAVAEPPPPDPFVAASHRAESLLKAMKTDEALAAYKELAKMRPQDAAVVGRYFNLARLKPGGPDFPKAAARVFSLDNNDEATSRLVEEAYKTYKAQVGRRLALPTATLERLALRFARSGHVTEAEDLALALLGAAGAGDHQPSVLLALTRARLTRNEREEASRHAHMLQTRFPASSEARMAADMLR
jgi:membrane associated rhomboid family serine protease